MSNRNFASLALALVVATAAPGCSGKAEQSKPVARNEARPAPPIPAPATPFGNSVEPSAYIHAGRFTADVMEPTTPPRAAELIARLQQAARKNPEWFREQVKLVKPGEPLPYDPRLGMSQAEYEDFLAMSRQMKMQKRGEVEISITSKGDGVYALDGGQRLPDLTGVEIDAVRREARTPYGVARGQAAFNASDDSALGAWNGVEWKLTQFDPKTNTGASVKVAIGKLHPSGRAVIYYNVTKADSSGKARILLVLNYDPGARL